MSGKRPALGRGLAALIPGAPPPSPDPSAPAGGALLAGAPREGLRRVPIEDLHPLRGQPRKNFDDRRMGQLADSIRRQGIIQPIVVRQRAAGGFEIVAGERRWRAAQRAGLRSVPAVVREIANEQTFEMALVENLQREDLNPIEEAEAFDRLMRDFGHTQEEIALRVGKDRATVANAVRLLKLPETVRALVVEGRLQMGHARALLGLDQAADIETLARRTVTRGLSVRQVEDLVRRARPDRPAAKPAGAGPAGSPSGRDLGVRLQRALGTKVRVHEAAPDRGHLEIHYASLDQLDGLLRRLLP